MSKSDKNHPHDRFFKLLFSKKQVAKSYINNFMSKNMTKELDLRTIKIAKDTFIDDNLKDHFSDIVYNCSSKKQKKVKICFLFEHKSNSPKYPHFQLMRYISNSWNNDLAQKRKPRIVVPIILYHGKRKWKVRKVSDYFNITPDSVFFPFIPKFDYHLTDLSNYSDEQILNIKEYFLVNGLILLKHKRDKEYLLKNTKIVFIFTEYYTDEEGRSFIKSMFIYMFDAFGLNQELIDELMDKLKKTKPMTHITFDKFVENARKEGEEIGIKKGEEIGIKKGEEKSRKKQIAIIEKCMLQFPDWSDKQIANFVEVEEALVKEIRENQKQNL